MCRFPHRCLIVFGVFASMTTGCHGVGTHTSDAPMALIPGGSVKSAIGPRLIVLRDFYIDVFEVTNIAYAKVRPYQYAPEKARHPVVHVLWRDARRYCEAVGKRLPTIEEWRRAALGSDGRRYPWGNDIDKTKANFAGVSGATTEVGTVPADKSPYGVFDMAGNVMEWTGTEVNGDPTYMTTVIQYGPDSFLSSPTEWSGASADFRSNNIGFRCAKDASK